MAFNPGEMVGPYRIIEQLGQGGMATVLKAYHAALDRYVALKVLHPAFLEDTNFTARFQREARLVAKLDHPNIVPIFDYSEHEGRPYLVMKFIEGETLKARQLRGPIASREILRIVEAIGEALAYAHKHGVLHRDIKPSNVLMSNDGGIYLADFGLARIAASGESTLSSDSIMGTPQYISPEQAMGKKDLDEGTDIYSFGVMLYELVVGKVPFSADTPFSIIHDHIYTPLPLPRQVNPEVSPEVERVLLKALSKERADRYADVPGMVAAFKEAWQAGGPQTRDESPTLVEKSPAPAAIPAPTVPAMVPPEVTTPANSVPAAAAAPLAGTVPGSAGRPKASLSWMWLAVGVVLVLACLVTLAALISVPWSGEPAAGGLVSTEPAGATVTPIPRRPASAVTPVSAPGLAAAIQAVTQSPDDPLVYVPLALAYAAVGQPDMAQEQITMIEKLAPPEPVLWLAAQKLADHDAWLMAARLRMDGAGMRLSGDKSLPDDLRDQLHQAIYQAFKEANAPDYVSFDRINKVDHLLAQLARARFNFYNKNRAEAQVLLTQLLQSDPGMPEAQLLQAEIYDQDGRRVAARQSLNEVYNNPRATAWMRSIADSIKGATP
jgi:serine/threonine protein kinase